MILRKKYVEKMLMPWYLCNNSPNETVNKQLHLRQNRYLKTNGVFVLKFLIKNYTGPPKKNACAFKYILYVPFLFNNSVHKCLNT